VTDHYVSSMHTLSVLLVVFAAINVFNFKRAGGAEQYVWLFFAFLDLSLALFISNQTRLL
jgi:hypothetical protein